MDHKIHRFFSDYPKFRKVGRIEYPIECPILDKNYHALYSITKKRIYYGCHKNCELCKQWSKPNNTWKSFSFFPIHCHFCHEPGHTDDFWIQNIFVMCNGCYSKMNKERKNLLNREIGIKF